MVPRENRLIRQTVDLEIEGSSPSGAAATGADLHVVLLFSLIAQKVFWATFIKRVARNLKGRNFK